MQFFTIATLFLATAFAAPAQDSTNAVERRAGSYSACPAGLYSNPQCCKVDVLSVASLDCSTPSETPSKCKPLANICAKEGKRAQCCVLPVLGQGILCQDAIGA